MLSCLLFAIMEEAGTAVMILTENVEREEFLSSHLTRAEVQRQLLIVADASAQVETRVRELTAELDWEAWDKVKRELRQHSGHPSPAIDELVWFAVRALAPATLIWLKNYRKNQPKLFAFDL